MDMPLKNFWNQNDKEQLEASMEIVTGCFFDRMKQRSII